MIEKKNHLQKLMDKQRKKSEMYVHSVQKANRYKAESYSLFLEIAKCREETPKGSLHRGQWRKGVYDGGRCR